MQLSWSKGLTTLLVIDATLDMRCLASPCTCLLAAVRFLRLRIVAKAWQPNLAREAVTEKLLHACVGIKI